MLRGRGGGRFVAGSTEALTTTSTTTVEQARAAELAADLPLIKALWRRGSDAWARGRDEGATFLGDNNHPEFTQGVRDGAGCRRSVSSFPEDTKVEFVLDDASVERDAGWIPPEMKTVPAGRIYIMKVTTSVNFQPAEAEENHVAVLDGRAYWFVGCKAPGA